jgi:hypothetical protein
MRRMDREEEEVDEEQSNKTKPRDNKIQYNTIK